MLNKSKWLIALLCAFTTLIGCFVSGCDNSKKDSDIKNDTSNATKKQDR